MRQDRGKRAPLLEVIGLAWVVGVCGHYVIELVSRLWGILGLSGP